MTPTAVTALLAKLPKAERFDAGRRIAAAEQQGFVNVRLYDKLPCDEYSMHDLIATNPKNGDVVFLFHCDWNQ